MKMIHGPMEKDPNLQQANLGLKAAMIALNLLLLVTGIVLMTLGAKINQHLASSLVSDDLPRLWGIGLLPIMIGILGIVCVLSGNKKWISAWVVVSTVLGVAGFVFFWLNGCLDPTTYTISIHVYGDCQQVKNDCACPWDDGSRWWVLEDRKCDTVRLITSLYISLVIIFILCLSAAVICAVLGCVLSCCLKHFVPKEDNRIELHTTIYGANMRPGPSSSSYFSPHYLLVPPSECTSSMMTQS